MGKIYYNFLMAGKKRLPKRSWLVALGIPTVFIPGLLLAAVLGWNWQRDLGKLGQTGGFKQSSEIFPDKVLAVEVLDGDTFETDKSLTIRMIGIDAPNRGEEGYEEAKDYLADLIGGEEVWLEYDYYKDDKYGRILAYVWEACSTQMGCKDGRRMINWVMIKKRLAQFVTYQDRRALKYKDFLLEAVEK